MWNQYFEPTSVEERRKLQAPDAAQLILTAFLLAGTALLMSLYTGCTNEGNLWIQVMFYGSVFWMVYMMTSLVGQYKNKTIRLFFRVIDYFFYLFHIGMFVWVWILAYHNKIQTDEVCNDAANWFTKIYVFIGMFFAIVLLVGICAGCLSLLRPRDELNTNLGGNSILNRNEFANNDGKFNPYGDSVLGGQY